MTLDKNTSPLIFHEAMDRASAFTPGKRLDTQSSADGDTVLSLDAVKSLDLMAMMAAEDELRACLDTVRDHKDLDSRIYTELFRKRLAEIAFIRAAHDQVTGETDKSAEIHEIQKSLYDHYSPALFQAALRKKIELLEATPVPADVEIAKARLLDELDGYASSIELDTAAIELEQPSEETLRAIGDWLRGQFEDIFDEIDAIEGDELDARQLAEVLDMAIMTTPDLRNNGWSDEVVQRNKNAVSVFASTRGIVVPEQARFPKTKAKALVVHEGFGHALKSGIAETNGNETGVTGTPTYSRFEESFEIALEQCLGGKYDPKRGIDHYVTIGFAETLGLPRDKIAQLTQSIHQILLASDGLTQDKIQKADKLTETQIRRTFAGLTDVDDGIAYRKDIDYLHGLNGAWRLLNAIVRADQVDEGMRWLLSAKFNPYDKNDQQLMSRYAVMPSSIKEALDI